MSRSRSISIVPAIFYAFSCGILGFLVYEYFNFPSSNDYNVEQDVAVISFLKQKHLFAHNPNVPTNYTRWAPFWGNMKQRMSHFIINRLSYKTEGFFVECGAFDGLALSNSLLLEQKYNWAGLLIEADPVPNAVLKSRNRHAWVADVCLSTSATPIKITMSTALEGDPRWNAGSHIENNILGNVADGRRKFEAQCYPLSLLLDAIGQKRVDYFSLDVEGVELDILKTIPFHRIKIQLINVEVRAGNKEDVKDFLESVGYRRILEMVDNSEAIHDDVYELIG